MHYIIAGLIIIGLIVFLVQWVVKFVAANIIAVLAIAVLILGILAIVNVTKRLIKMPLSIEEAHINIDNEGKPLRLLHLALEHNRKLYNRQ